MPLPDLQRLLGAKKETPGLEFKEAKNQFSFDKLCEYCVAIGNEGGGWIILGVTDSFPRDVVGSLAFPDPEEIRVKLYEKLRFRIDAHVLAHEGKRVLAFEVPSRARGLPFHLNGQYLMRLDDQLLPMSPERLRTIFEEGKPDFLFEVAAPARSLDDVFRLLDTQVYYLLLKLPYPASRNEVISRFIREKLVIERGGLYDITNLGAITFARQLDEFDGLTRRVARVIVYEGINKLKTRLDAPGRMGYAVGFQALIAFICAQLPQREVIEDSLRREQKTVPDLVVRELVANALVHQDFDESGFAVVVEIYADRFEISNPGRPFIEPRRFIDSNSSRNEQLADLMRRLGMCEEKGSGIDKVIDAAEQNQLPAPEFREAVKHTVATIYFPRKFSAMSSEDRIRACYQHCVLRYLSGGAMTNQSLRERFSLPETKAETASRIIRDTLELGYIRQADESKSKRYARYLPFFAGD